MARRRTSFCQYPNAATRANSSQPIPPTGLIFPGNYAAGGDIGINFAGSNYQGRVGFTKIWKILTTGEQAGYFGESWESPADNSWDFGHWSCGAHPYPANSNAVDGNGQSTDPGGTGGLTHFYEIAGIANGGSSKDYICSPGGTPKPITTGVWLSRALVVYYVTVTTTNDTVRHRFYPDVDGDPSYYIEQDITASTLTSMPAMMSRWGTSPWRSGQGGGPASSSDETPYGVMRHLLLYNTNFSIAQIQAKLALTSNDTTDANRWYSNINPTPSDISDKSGMGHHPTWANTNRPTLYAE